MSLEEILGSNVAEQVPSISQMRDDTCLRPSQRGHLNKQQVRARYETGTLLVIKSRQTPPWRVKVPPWRVKVPCRPGPGPLVDSGQST